VVVTRRSGETETHPAEDVEKGEAMTYPRDAMRVAAKEAADKLPPPTAEELAQLRRILGPVAQQLYRDRLRARTDGGDSGGRAR
jgi:hypothetical protein